MAVAVIMPRQGNTVESCIITEWKKKPGDAVAVGDILFSYETDKAAFECEAEVAGTLLKVLYEEGDDVPCLENVCVIGQPGEDPDAAQIDAMHRRLGWSGVGYHYIIRKDGTIEEGRPAFAVGAHAEGVNAQSLGVALCGNFCEEEPTAAQIESTAMLLAMLSATFGVEPDRTHIVGHRDLMATACPGDALYERMDEFIGKAIWYCEQ